MATREKKFILEFDAPYEYGSGQNTETRYDRVAIAPHQQKNKFPNLYAVYIWKYNGLKKDWVKEYYYDREQRCFFRPYKMQYLESVCKETLYIRDKLIAFFATQEQKQRAQQQEPAVETEQPASKPENTSEVKQWAKKHLAVVVMNSDGSISAEQSK